MRDGVVVTGATGFLGSAVVRAALAEGRKVTALVRKSSDTRRLQSLDVNRIVYDPSDFNDVVVGLSSENPVTFIHCAWRGVVGKDRNATFQADNISASLNSVHLAAEIGCTQWIGLGSQAEYGNANERLSETSTTSPTTEYGKAKLATGQRALEACDAAGLLGTWVRVFSTYGPDDSPDWLIPYVIQEFLAGRPPRLTACEQRWDYLYVTDAGRAVSTLADGRASGIFNLGSGVALPLREFVEIAREETGSVAEADYGAVPYRPDQVMHLEADISRLLEQTRWRPEVGPREGVRATVAFERRRPVYPQSDIQ